MTFNTHVTIRIGLRILQGSSFTLFFFFFFALPCTLKLRFVSFQHLGTVLNYYCVVEHHQTKNLIDTSGNDKNILRNIKYKELNLSL